MKIQVFNHRTEKNAIVDIDDNATDDQIMDKVYDELRYQSWVGFRL